MNTSNKSKWDSLSMRDKAMLIKMGIASHVTNIDEIKNIYNRFAAGGKMNVPSNWDYDENGKPLLYNEWSQEQLNEYYREYSKNWLVDKDGNVVRNKNTNMPIETDSEEKYTNTQKELLKRARTQKPNIGSKPHKVKAAENFSNMMTAATTVLAEQANTNSPSTVSERNQKFKQQQTLKEQQRKEEVQESLHRGKQLLDAAALATSLGAATAQVGEGIFNNAAQRVLTNQGYSQGMQSPSYLRLSNLGNKMGDLYKYLDVSNLPIDVLQFATADNNVDRVYNGIQLGLSGVKYLPINNPASRYVKPFTSFVGNIMEPVSRVFKYGGEREANTKYTVKKGDSFWKIAKEKNIPFSDLLKANPSFKTPNLIYIGDEIVLPDYKDNSTSKDNSTNQEYSSERLAEQQPKLVDTNVTSNSDNINEERRHYAYSGNEVNDFYGRGSVNVIDAPGGARKLSREELSKFNKLTGNNIKYRRDDGSREGGTYAYLGEDGTIKSIGSAPLNPSTSVPAEVSNWGNKTFHNIASLASLYNTKTNTYDLNALDPEARKGFEKAQKETGYNPETAYFALNKYLSEKGNQIPEKWRREFNIDDKRIKYLQTVAENPHSTAYLYNFNPDYHKTADVIDHDIPVNALRGLRTALAVGSKGLSEMAIQGATAGLDFLGNLANREKAKEVLTGLSSAINDTDPAINWVANPIIKYTNDNNLGTAASAGATAALTGKGILGKTIAGLGTAGSVELGNNLTSKGHGVIGDIVSNYGSSLFGIIGSGGTNLFRSSGANAARQAINVGTRAALNSAEDAGLRYLVGLGADAIGMEDAQKENLKVLATSGISEGLSRFRQGTYSNKVLNSAASGINRVQNWVNTVSPGSDIINTMFTRSGGRPDLGSAIANVINDNPFTPWRPFKTDTNPWYNKQPSIKMVAEAANVIPNKLYQGYQAFKHPEVAENYIYNTYSGITVNSGNRRQGAPSNYEQYQGVKARQFSDPENPNKVLSTNGINDYSVPENFRYRDYDGHEIRVPSNKEVSQQSLKVRMAGVDDHVSFDTSVPLWSFVSGKMELKKGQSVQYSNAKVSNTTLQDGDVFYNTTDKGKNNVTLIEPTTILDSSIATQVMTGGEPARVHNSRYVTDNLTKHGYTRYDEINMGNQNVDAQKSIGEINGTQVDMNLKGCTTKVSVYSKAGSSDRTKDVIVITDSDLASPGSAREHYAVGNNERDIARTRNSLGLNNKENYQNQFITKDKYTVEEAQQILQEVRKDLNKKQKGIVDSAEPVEVIANAEGEVSVTKMRQYIGHYFNAAVGNITASKSLSTKLRVASNKKVRNLATGVSFRVVTDLGSTQFTREEVRLKLGDLENPAKGTLRYSLQKLETQKKDYSIDKLSDETRQKLAAEGYKIFDDNGNLYSGKVNLTQKHAAEVGVSAEYNQAYDSQSKKLKALIAFGEGADIRQALKK